MRLSRRKKRWLLRTVPNGVCRSGCIGDGGHSKETWRALWGIWTNPEGRFYRFIRTDAWFAERKS